MVVGAGGEGDISEQLVAAAAAQGARRWWSHEAAVDRGPCQRSRAAALRGLWQGHGGAVTQHGADTGACTCRKRQIRRWPQPWRPNASSRNCVHSLLPRFPQLPLTSYSGIPGFPSPSGVGVFNARPSAAFRICKLCCIPGCHPGPHSAVQDTRGPSPSVVGVSTVLSSIV